jgi:hypothetical protein
LNKEIQVILNVLAPLINPITGFANQAVSTAGTTQNAVTGQVMQITAAISPVMAMASGPVNTFVAQTGLIGALATLQGAMA